eukprot:523302-Pelagomonas_calceolata.AAC.2
MLTYLPAPLLGGLFTNKRKTMVQAAEDQTSDMGTQSPGWSCFGESQGPYGFCASVVVLFSLQKCTPHPYMKCLNCSYHGQMIVTHGYFYNAAQNLVRLQSRDASIN